MFGSMVIAFVLDFVTAVGNKCAKRRNKQSKKDSLLVDNDEPEGGTDFRIIRAGLLKSVKGR